MAISAFLACGVVSELALAGDRGVTAPPPACRYTVTVLQSTLTCGSQPENLIPKAINANGDIAGERFCAADSRRPFLAPTTGGYQSWSNPPGAFDLSVDGLNEGLEIVGQAQFSTAPIQGYLRKANGEYLLLSFPPTGTFSAANGVNQSSLVVGTWGNQQVGPGLVPCTWQDGRLTDLSGILGATKGEALGINSRGQITGWTGNIGTTSDARAFILDGDRVTILPVAPGTTTGQGKSINAHGDIAGSGWAPGQGWRAMAYIDGQVIALGVLPGLTNSIAYGINDSKVVVGSSSSKAFVWQDGVMRKLNDLIPAQPAYTLKFGFGIHNDSWIIVSGTLGGVSGPSRAFLLTPVYPSAADLNGDCHVNGLDLGMILAAWGTARPLADVPADINHDGVVNGIDLALLLAQWG